MAIDYCLLKLDADGTLVEDYKLVSEEEAKDAWLRDAPWKIIDPTVLNKLYLELRKKFD